MLNYQSGKIFFSWKIGETGPSPSAATIRIRCGHNNKRTGVIVTIQVFTTNQFNSLSTEAHVWDYDIYNCICRCLAPSGAWPSTSTTLHYNDVITSAIASQITSRPHDCLLNRLFKRRSKKTSKAPRNWPLWGEFSGDRWICHTKGQ